jgi:hypothetical protein
MRVELRRQRLVLRPQRLVLKALRRSQHHRRVPLSALALRLEPVPTAQCQKQLALPRIMQRVAVLGLRLATLELTQPCPNPLRCSSCRFTLPIYLRAAPRSSEASPAASLPAAISSQLHSTSAPPRHPPRIFPGRCQALLRYVVRGRVTDDLKEKTEPRACRPRRLR